MLLSTYRSAARTSSVTDAIAIGRHEAHSILTPVAKSSQLQASLPA
ncbi:MAG: hypothetical protein IJ680_03385 [Paludibacteraceae bacterium]|nr:hypothetical protein [Paludibacteraceae bacterium]